MKAHIVAACRRSLRLDKHCQNQIAHHFVMLERLFQRAAEFDIIHFHIDYLHFPLSRRELITHVTTLHGRSMFLTWFRCTKSFMICL